MILSVRCRVEYSTAPGLAWWSANLLPDRPQCHGANEIRIDFDMASTAAEACSLMSDESAESALLTALTSDLQSQMMITVAHDEMNDSHWMVF